MKVALVILTVVILGAAAFFFVRARDETPSSSTSSSSNDKVSWEFDGEGWDSTSTPAACPEPLVFPAPVDVNLASGILYPGQIRGSDYKPHGGFRFDNRDTNDIEVRAIMDGYILKASRYDDGSEIQNFMFYVNPCGLMVMHDHLRTLSPKLQEAFDKLPLNKNGDSRTTFVEPKVYIEKGEVLATEIGYKNFEGRKNIFVDFGLYDLRGTNDVAYDADFRSKHPNINEYGAYALCWFEYLSEEDESVVRSLQAGGHEGKVSDYCK